MCSLSVPEGPHLQKEMATGHSWVKGQGGDGDIFEEEGIARAKVLRGWGLVMSKSRREA